MNVPVIIGHCCLLAMTQAGHGCQYPDPIRPLRSQTQTDGCIDRDKPKITGHTVQYPSDLGLLSGHTCQLSVGTVVHVGPNQQAHAYHIQQKIVVIKQYPCRNSQKDGSNRYRIGSNSHFMKKKRPSVTDRTVKQQIDPLFGIRRF